MSLPLRTLVIADDEPGVRAYLQRLIQEAGYTCLGVAETGQGAIDLVGKVVPQLALVDVHMPEAGGLQAAQEIMKTGKTGVLMMTGDADPQLMREAMDLGACGYLLKPMDSSQINAILETAWHRFQTIAVLHGKNVELTEALELRKIVEKAKGILMEQQGLSEADAHRTLQCLSQEQGIPMKEVCRSLIQVRQVLGKSILRPRK